MTENDGKCFEEKLPMKWAIKTGIDLEGSVQDRHPLVRVIYSETTLMSITG